MTELVLWLDKLRMTDLAKVGGKNASLGEMIGNLARLGVSVPGFATATLLILLMAVAFGYYSPIKYVSLIENPLKNLEIMIFPAIVMGTSMAGSVMRMTRP